MAAAARAYNGRLMRRWATLLLLLLPAWAQDSGSGGLDGPTGPPPKTPEPKEEEEEGCGEEEEAPEAPSEPSPEGVDPVQARFDKAVALQKKGKYVAAKRAFRKILKEHPDHPLAPLARDRGGDNAFLGVEVIQESGPPERRIDVSVMGDGFTLEEQKMERDWAGYCLDVLYNEKVFDEYRSYFNFYFVRLASFEEGVDPGLSPEELKKAQERNLRRRRDINYKLDYSTALDCKAAGPQGQVMADPTLVYKWLDAGGKEVPGCADDKFVIAFARFGILGMGGGGIANVGRPDKSVTVHEFGHAFSRLLDEYAINPDPPQGMFGRALMAPNAHPSPEEPKPDDVPWAHMLRRKVKGVGIYEGGATFKKGVWKPARTCAMNVGGNQFCPVCREQTLLVIYEYVSPLDVATPDPAKDVGAHGRRDRARGPPDAADQAQAQGAVVRRPPRGHDGERRAGGARAAVARRGRPPSPPRLSGRDGREPVHGPPRPGAARRVRGVSRGQAEPPRPEGAEAEGRRVGVRLPPRQAPRRDLRGHGRGVGRHRLRREGREAPPEGTRLVARQGHAAREARSRRPLFPQALE
jgi:hypothetical protein